MLNSIYSQARRLFHRLFENELIRRVVKNSGYLLSATVITAAIGMVQSILAARLLGVAAFGILGVITMFATVLNKLVSFRMSELVVKYVGQFTETGDQPRAAATFKAAALAELGASTVAFTLVWLLAPVGARYFAKDPTTAGWFAAYALVILANLIAESSTGLLQIFNRFRQFSLVSVISSLVTLSIIVITTISHGGFAGILAAYIAGKTFEAVSLSVLAIREATHRWSNQWWRTPISLLRPQGRQMVSFAINTNISASLSLITKDSELLWVALLRSPLEAGYYKVAMSLANIVQLPISPLPQATYPELSREVARKNWDNVRYVLRQGSLLAGSYSLAVTLFLILLGRPLLSILYKPEFLPAYPALLILLAGFLVANTFYWNRVALLSIGRADIPTKVNLVLAILKILGIFLLVPIYGYLASAALLAGSYILGVSYAVLRFRSEIRKREHATGAPTISEAKPNQK
jgi:O-antigen/teichoic acid export membrane protein